MRLAFDFLLFTLTTTTSALTMRPVRPVHPAHLPLTSAYLTSLPPLPPDFTLSLAPMMEYTDRHFRHLCRLISPEMELWSEMVTANAIVNTKEVSLAQKWRWSQRCGG